MGNINNLLRRACKQTAVYWANPQDDGYGNKTFDDPVEIKCRWEDIRQVLGTVGENTTTGYDIIPRAIVYLTQDVDEEGLLYLGTLDDLDSTQEDNPMTIEGICIIKRPAKIPSLGSTTDFLYKAFLTPWLT
jgi:hypothetical protein